MILYYVKSEKLPKDTAFCESRQRLSPKLTQKQDKENKRIYIKAKCLENKAFHTLRLGHDDIRHAWTATGFSPEIV